MVMDPEDVGVDVPKSKDTIGPKPAAGRWIEPKRSFQQAPSSEPKTVQLEFLTSAVYCAEA
ncbi:hypothetical protein GSI_08939 [Ganoderma sinense ZZ0214-1]|uniref:Uncharacterized protein n=1 Tax=Ganoderma sinense ZZ0214-1 TaxID=1077348 RepID=A0A2G8S542_9APHY|nr:hypothetical protein GSI_08939 [Ganoderma sinense ZZ0214-1]